MPCWYFEKKELRNTPSFQDGIDTETENRYRREGARFIMDAGTKMGLRYDTCATGVVYFHRFYMFHSFKEFHRYITAACCLFLAGKVEETPKKCRDIIKICQNLLSPELFTVFGNDPKEEVITMERILLQTIKFDLQVEHPYGLLLKYAKLVKGDKEKVQKLVQMAWTFINDSMCTTLSLQWEPEVIATSLMYLATRLNKFDIQDWHGKPPGSKMKWWEGFVEGLSVELMEDICHKVLDLYSSKQQREESPPTQQEKRTKHQNTPPPPPPQPAKRSASNPPADSHTDAKMARMERSKDRERKEIERVKDSANSAAGDSVKKENVNKIPSLLSLQKSEMPPSSKSQSQHTTPVSGFGTMTPKQENQYNPYLSGQMYSSSFLSQEGSRNIQTILSGGGGGGSGGGNEQYDYRTQPPQTIPQANPSYPPPAPYQQGQLTQQAGYQQAYPQTAPPYSVPPGQPPYQTQPGAYPPQTYPSGTTVTQQGFQPAAPQAYQAGNFPTYPPSQFGNQYGVQQAYPPQTSYQPQPQGAIPGQAPPGQTFNNSRGQRMPNQPPNPQGQLTGLATVRITGRK